MTGLGFPAIMIAAVIPAFLYYLSIFMQVDLYSAKNKLARLEDEDIPGIGDVLREG